jgi:small subunit ribosomal protein S14
VATDARMAKQKKTLKFKVRVHHRCQRCGRPRAYMRKFGLCRICFRNLARQGYLPGVIKASW